MGSGQTSNADVDIDLGRLFASLRERWLRIALVCVSVAVIAFILASMAAPSYRAETRILIETRESPYTRPQSANTDDRPILDSEGIASQVEVIDSTDILKKVADELDLAHHEEFEADDLSLVGRLMVMAGLKSDPGNVAAENRVLRKLREKLEIYRVTDSRVIAVRFSSHDPELAAKVPNAIADAYLEVQKQAKIESNTSATDWLKPEIAELRKSVQAAEARVADYRAKSDLLVGQNNSVLATQQLSEISSELSRVKAARAAAEAKAQAVRAAMKDGTSIETLPAVLASSLIQRLRERQVELQSQIADLSTTLLANHPHIRALNSQLVDLDRQIREEARKVLEGLETEAETARLREQELVGELNTLKAQAARADQQQVELRALQRDAESKRQLLESYLTRYSEAASRGESAYLPPDARVISRAMTPSLPYFPKIIPITAAAFAASLLLMIIATLLTELFSGRAMRPAPLPVAAIPQVAMPVVIAPVVEEAAVADDADGPPKMPVMAAMGEAAAAQLGIDAAAEKLMRGRANRAVFVSPEGDAAAASSVLVARMVADSGLRVILVDLTNSGAASVPMLETTAFPGITNLLASEAQFCDVIRGDLYSDCHIIPIGTASGTRAMRAADRLPIITESLATAYDVVIIECGHANADALRRLVGENSVIMVSALDPDEGPAVGTAKQLAAAGLGETVLVTPAEGVPPAPRGRDAA
jgi:uncharacterized protein involved in exopolysaccharide biosynthesis/Mrp family chromosome partitioning ATPase